MTRPPLRRLEPAEFDEHQRALYDQIIGGPRAAGPQHFRLVDDGGCLEGPFNAFLLQPAVGDPLQVLGGAIRYATSLSDRSREIAILVVAAAWASSFEQYAHEPIARAAGLTDTELEAIRAGRAADTSANWADSTDLTLVRVTRALSEEGDLDDELYTAALARFGEAALFELTTLVGYYATLALQLRVFRVDTPGTTTTTTTTDQPATQGTKT